MFDQAAAIAEVIAGFPCTRVAADDTARAGRVALTGTVASFEDRADLGRRIGAVPGVEAVSMEALLVVEAPCALFEFLNAADRLAAESAGLAATQEPLPPVRVVHPGEVVTFRLTTPSFPSHVLLDYFTPEGAVYHLDRGNWPQDRFPADTQTTFGGKGDYGTALYAQLPAGREFMLAVASSVPLHPRPRPPEAEASAYLADLSASIGEALSKDARVEIFVTIIETSDEAPVVDR